MKRFLPVLSGSLRTILENLRKDYDQDEITKEILRVDRIMEFYLANKDSVPEICPVFEEELCKSLKNEVIMLSGRYGEEFEVSFLPADREPVYTDDGKWGRANRQTGRPGKIFQKLISKEFKQYDWEQFVNRFKATMCCSNNFEIVEGEQITYWYNSDHYYRCEGTLGNSCMKYDECENFFKIYEDNAKMLICTKNGMLTGRALVWEVDGVTLLDRIYTCYDYLENCFIEYAKERKWWIRANNCLLNNGDNQEWKTPDDNYTESTDREFRIHLKDHYDYFPYVDSFRYYNGDKCISTNDVFSNYLSNTDGNYDGGCRWECYNCGASYFSAYDDDVPDELHYSEREGEYYCDDCCWWCEYLEDYIPNSDHAVRVHTDSETVEEMPESEVEDNSDYILIDDEYYDATEFDIRQNKITGDYEIVK